MSRKSKPTEGDSLIEHYLERLSPLGAVSFKRMFGASCLFLDGKAFGVLEAGELFLKVDAESKPRFVEAGGHAFVYEHGESGRRIEMSYVTVPEGDLDDDDALLAWGRLAAAASRRGAPARSKAKPAATAKAAKKSTPKKPAPKAR